MITKIRRSFYDSWIVIGLDMVSIIVLCGVFFDTVRLICDDNSPWAPVLVPILIFAPIWAGLRIALAWKANEDAKRKRREDEERQTRFLQEQSGKN